MADFKRLDVYRLALRFVQLAFAALARLPSGNAELAQQLRKAALSIPLNIAEGSGRPEGPDRNRFRAFARGSAMECAAIWDVLRAMGALEDEVFCEGDDAITRVIEMLSKMVPRGG
jgi:four helix bundle protein